MSIVTRKTSKGRDRYSTLEGQVEEFQRRRGRVIVSTKATHSTHNLPVGAMLGLNVHAAPRKGDRVKLTFSGDRAVVARLQKTEVAS